MIIYSLYLLSLSNALINIYFSFTKDDRSALIEQDERRRDQLQAQDQIVEDDLAMIQEREERIRQLEVDLIHLLFAWKHVQMYQNVTINKEIEGIYVCCCILFMLNSHHNT